MTMSLEEINKKIEFLTNQIERNKNNPYYEEIIGKVRKEIEQLIELRNNLLEKEKLVKDTKKILEKHGFTIKEQPEVYPEKLRTINIDTGENKTITDPQEITDLLWELDYPNVIKSKLQLYLKRKYKGKQKYELKITPEGHNKHFEFDLILNKKYYCPIEIEMDKLKVGKLEIPSTKTIEKWIEQLKTIRPIGHQLNPNIMIGTWLIKLIQFLEQLKGETIND